MGFPFQFKLYNSWGPSFMAFCFVIQCRDYPRGEAGKQEEIHSYWRCWTHLGLSWDAAPWAVVSCSYGSILLSQCHVHSPLLTGKCTQRCNNNKLQVLISSRVFTQGIKNKRFRLRTVLLCLRFTNSSEFHEMHNCYYTGGLDFTNVQYFLLSPNSRTQILWNFCFLVSKLCADWIFFCASAIVMTLSVSSCI